MQTEVARPQPAPGGNGPVERREHAPREHAPLVKVDREKTCPFLMRTFVKVGGQFRPEDFESPHKLPEDELQIYTWHDATLREITDLVRDVKESARGRGAKLVFSLVYPDSRGRMNIRDVGVTFSSGRRTPDEHRRLDQLRFQIGFHRYLIYNKSE
jgi:histone deacetylase complex subunit SAP18